MTCHGIEGTRASATRGGGDRAAWLRPCCARSSPCLDASTSPVREVSGVVSRVEESPEPLCVAAFTCRLGLESSLPEDGLPVQGEYPEAHLFLLVPKGKRAAFDAGASHCWAGCSCAIREPNQPHRVPTTADADVVRVLRTVRTFEASGANSARRSWTRPAEEEA